MIVEFSAHIDQNEKFLNSDVIFRISKKNTSENDACLIIKIMIIIKIEN